jgi:hypothetical protein
MDWDGGSTWYRIEGDLGLEGRQHKLERHSSPPESVSQAPYRAHKQRGL